MKILFIMLIICVLLIGIFKVLFLILFVVLIGKIYRELYFNCLRKEKFICKFDCVVKWLMKVKIKLLSFVDCILNVMMNY